MIGFIRLLCTNVLNRLVHLVSGANLLLVLSTLSIWVGWADVAYADGGDVCDYPDEWYKHLECWFWNYNSGFVGTVVWLGTAVWGAFSGTLSGLFSSKPSARRRRRPPPAGRGWPEAIKTLLKINKSDGREYRRKVQRIRAAEPIWRILIGLGSGGITYASLQVLAATVGATTLGPLILGISVVAGGIGVFAPDVLGVIIKWINGGD